ncbi:sensor histidine kinase [Actinosynnema pretiosum]|uniref:sensor histidine kinase n=1 Tax=Actinosynnema pretiosum TaxID=42197 RepID=UPI000A57C668|nr:histidine kinase [Actinosynnema pretiosum]
MAAAAPARRGVLAAEVAALLGAVVVDLVLTLRFQPLPQGVTASLLTTAAPAAGSATAVLAALRRRFPRHLAPLALAALAVSAASTLFRSLVPEATPEPVAAEAVAVALLVGAVCRRLPARRAGPLAVAALLVVSAAPVARYGVGEPLALLAVPVTALWAGGMAVGLLLRDADARQRAELDRVRVGERMQLARELHDLVAHHVSGVVVRAQAARVLGGSDEVFAEIEAAGSDALAAMRRVVGMLRSPDYAVPRPGADFGEVVRSAVGDTPNARVELAEDVAGAEVPPELSTTVHRVVLECLTNARKHAPDATEVVVSARRHGGDWLLEVVNDGAGEPGAGGFGLVGMRERVSALGGELSAGLEDGGRWRVGARLPTTAPRGL